MQRVSFPMSNLKGKDIVLGVTGSIACYKSAMLASLLIQNGANVDVVMTSSAQKFLHPSLFKGITHRPVITDIFADTSPLSADHIALAKKDCFVVAPATANTIARMAYGFSDDPLTCSILATTSPIVVAPAMETHMFQNFIVQENIEKLKENGFYIVGPEEGYLASGAKGQGRMSEPVDIAEHVNVILGEKGDLSHLKILVTAGGTKESLDPVRFIHNKSSGKMGYALAFAAKERGAKVTLISAADLEPPKGVKYVAVKSALEMFIAVKDAVDHNDVLIMAAAVADWRAKEIYDHKFKKGTQGTWDLELVRTPDILKELREHDILKVGFAAETENIITNAMQKLTAKNLDLIVANDVSDPKLGFGSNQNEVYIITPENGEKLPVMPKYEVANEILNDVKRLCSA